MTEAKPRSLLNKEKTANLTHFLILPLKAVGCWDWYQNPKSETQLLLNYTYVAMVLFILLNLPITLMVNLYSEWTDIMASLDKLADGLPLLISVAIVPYFALNRTKMYELIDYMNRNFKYHSARGLTNMTMEKSYIKAKKFAYFYTACAMFSITMYVTMPVIIHFSTKQPLQPWIYMDITRAPFFVITFLRQFLAQGLVGLAVGQLGVFFASNSILLCGQLDLLCCSLRNVRYTSLLMRGVQHSVLKASHDDIVDDEKHSYIYNEAEMEKSDYHYDKKVNTRLQEKISQYDIYSTEHDMATVQALRDCALVCQVINTYKQKFEEFVSPMLALRVIQLTLYLCTLLYAATLAFLCMADGHSALRSLYKFDMLTVEYLAAVALDTFVYCYFGNQIIIQADRVSTAAYQSAWHTMGVRPRRIMLNILLSARRPIVVRAGWFLPMDLHTFVVIIKTSFSYYTLLVKVNEK